MPQIIRLGMPLEHAQKKTTRKATKSSAEVTKKVSKKPRVTHKEKVDPTPIAKWEEKNVVAPLSARDPLKTYLYTQSTYNSHGIEPKAMTAIHILYDYCHLYDYTHPTLGGKRRTVMFEPEYFVPIYDRIHQWVGDTLGEENVFIRDSPLNLLPVIKPLTEGAVPMLNKCNNECGVKHGEFDCVGTCVKKAWAHKNSHLPDKGQSVFYQKHNLGKVPHFGGSDVECRLDALLDVRAAILPKKTF